MKSRVLRHAAQVGALALVAAAFTPAAMAMGTFAAGIPDDVAAKGVAVGAGYNYQTQAGADQRALQECQGSGADASTKALCKVVDRFQNRCLTVSLDPKAGTPGWGWAIADNSTLSSDQALSMCRQTAGADRAPYCVVTFTDCDGYAK